MIRITITLLLSMLLSMSRAAETDNPVVIMETSLGTLTIELWPDHAPVTVENFLRYVDNGLYDGLVFHRVIPGFMVQGGGFDEEMARLSSPYPAIRNEAREDVPNDRGTLAMARTGDIDSATSQFFINLVNNDFLNRTGSSPSSYGYAVFGEVIKGMDVVDEIAAVQTTTRNGYQDVPVEAVVIEKVTRQSGE